MATVICLLPDHDFDVTEVAVPWKILTRAGHFVVFATEEGRVAAADPKLLEGVLFGQLGAADEPKRFYREMIASETFTYPRRWRDLVAADYDALLLPGGHAPGMRQYLGSRELADFVRRFWVLGRPVGAICHGVLVLARADVLKGTRTTCLPKYMERTAYLLTAWKLGRYYRTYDAYVEDEVKASLADEADFVLGPYNLTARGTDGDDRAAFVVEDGRYVSARWPGDAYLFARKLLAKLRESLPPIA